MCGIWAYFTKGKTIESADKYVKKLLPRGPEFINITNINGIGTLGFTRLPINGLTPEGNQPFVSDGISVICNGEIYNHKELRHRLGLADAVSDCYIILQLYKLGLNITEICRTLDGVFAFIIVDENIDTVLIARDPYGVRPLYVAEYASGDVAYSSEIKGLPENATTIKPFPPGTWRLLNNSEFKYHTVPHTKIPAFTDYEIAKSSLRTSLINAVRKRLLSERPIGALLSGGIDSSLIAAIAARELNREGKRLHTFSIGMPESPDLYYAQKVADHIGSIHHTVILTTADFLNAIPTVIKSIESYDITTIRASVGNWLIGKYIKENTDIKVVFNGDGSDEVGGGYLYFYNAPTEEEFEAETERLLTDIHQYDVLRSDRCIAAHGLEARTPFLDKSVVATWKAIPTAFRMPLKNKENGRMIKQEKLILRDAFKNDDYLPVEILWRRKEAFSDGVSATTDSWYKKCADYALEKQCVSIGEYSHNPPKTAEAAWYRQIFELEYGSVSALTIPYMWLPRWTNTTDPSARTLAGIY